MRGILVQVVQPPLVAGGIFAIGYLLGFTLLAMLIGTLVGTALGVRVAYRLMIRLEFFNLIGEPDGVTILETYPFGARNDELDDVFVKLSTHQRALQDDFASQIGTFSRQSQLLDMMNDGIMRVDADGIVSYANVSAGALFRGRNPTGRSFIEVTRDHELSELVEANLESGEDKQHTFEFPGDNTVFNAVITRISSAPPEALVVLRDITEVTRLQMLRRDFVANVSHDLRTPLSAIKIMTETLLDIRRNDPESEQFLTRIDDEVNVMTSLVNDLLDLASLEGRESRLSLRKVDVTLMVEDVRERMAPIADRHEVALVVNIEPDLPIIQADQQRLNQALVNLVNNAIAYTPSGGEVEIAVSKEDRDVVFEVRDTGVGIHPADLPRVWERFFRADRARTGRGTGLGLAIVKHVVLAHGGTMDATSELGKGSVFRISIPVSQRPRSSIWH